MKKEAFEIVNAAIKAADPYINTKRLVSELFPKGTATVMSIGKAAVPMAKAAEDVLGDRIKTGLLVTKYAHSEGYNSPYYEIIESAHPVSDENSIKAARRGLEIANSLTVDDTLLVLLSGGGSALFEDSIISPVLQRDITSKLLSRCASIREINAVRKRLSLVKGGALAAAAYPAKVITVALSDVLSNDKSVIASGITFPDGESQEFLRETVNKYLSDIPEEIKNLIYKKREFRINDGGYYFAGDINILCDAAGEKAEEMGFTVHHRERDLSGEAKDEAVRLLRSIPHEKGKHCYIFGGETVVTLKGKGKGGRNQEMALSAAIELRGKKGISFISVGSDGTDGPTDDAGGFSDGTTYDMMCKVSVSPEKELADNNSNYALMKVNSLVTTGPTGTNVNDITLILTDNY
ncbi:MAG: DUF4147 domain-containing protein [Clostridia bacterium]|nr:DUF4147 domain-containing protein [Clostridia bacterium]